MTFTNPSALMWAALAAPIIVFYLLKVRMRRVDVASVMFWQQVVEKKPPRAIWRRVRHLMSLLLQLVSLGLVVAALGDPESDEARDSARRTVVVLDISASMKATASRSTRFELAREHARRLIAAMRERDEMAIISASGHPRAVCGLTSHPGTLKAGLDEVKCTDSTARVQEAIAVAQHLLGDSADGEVIVLTDGCLPDTDLSQFGNVSFCTFGDDQDNAAITSFQVRRSFDDPVAFQVLAQLRNFGRKPVRCSLDLTLNGEVLDVTEVELEPEGRWSRIFEYTSASGGPLKLTLNTDDALDVDNEAFAVLLERKRIPVILVTEGNWFLQQVLEAHPLVDLTVTSDLPESTDSESVTVIHRRVIAAVPDGKVFIIQPGSSTDLFETNGIVEGPLVGLQIEDDLLANVHLDNISIASAVRLRPAADSTTLIESVAGDPLYVKFNRSTGIALVLAIDLEAGDLPLRTAFPILISNALSVFAGDKGEFVAAKPAGTPLSLQLPEGLAAVVRANQNRAVLESPSGLKKSVTIPDDGVYSVSLPHSGIWNLYADDGSIQDPQIIACNVDSSTESNLRAIDVGREWEKRDSGQGGAPLWFYLLLLAFLLLLCEWYLFQRRWIN